MDRNEKEKRLMEWVLAGWPRNARGEPEEIRVFVLSPEDVVCAILARFSDEQVDEIMKRDAFDMICSVEKGLHWGFADWPDIIESAIGHRMWEERHP